MSIARSGIVLMRNRYSDSIWINMVAVAREQLPEVKEQQAVDNALVHGRQHLDFWLEILEI